MWKPGQIVTIRGKKYRITKDTVDFDCTVCDHCDMPVGREPCHTCLWGHKMPDNCHLQEIKPKSVMG